VIRVMSGMRARGEQMKTVEGQRRKRRSELAPSPAATTVASYPANAPHTTVGFNKTRCHLAEVELADHKVVHAMRDVVVRDAARKATRTCERRAANWCAGTRNRHGKGNSKAESGPPPRQRLGANTASGKTAAFLPSGGPHGRKAGVCGKPKEHARVRHFPGSSRWIARPQLERN
jgi:hypothetical protein